MIKCINEMYKTYFKGGQKMTKERKKELKRFSLFTIKMIGIVLITQLLSVMCQGCKTFNESALENSENEMVASYALCIRAMSDGTTEVSGKNVSFCNGFMKESINESRYKKCIKLSDNPQEIKHKKRCFHKIFGIEL